jgi:hypothetical protein
MRGQYSQATARSDMTYTKRTGKLGRQKLIRPNSRDGSSDALQVME